MTCVTQNTSTPSQGGKIRKGMKLILRLIRKERLAVGDKLPSQSQLRKILGLTNFVISGAMQEMVAANVVTRNGKAGTTFLGLDSLPPNVFTIAVAAISPTRQRVTPAAAQTFTHMMASLFESGASMKTYFRSTVTAWTPPLIDEFQGLSDDVEDGEIDAVLLPLLLMRMEDQRKLSNMGIPVVFCGACDNTFSGVVIDHRGFASEATQMLASQGCRRLAIANLDKPKNGYALFWDGFEEGLAKAGMAANKGELLSANLQVGPEGGVQIAQSILQRPKDSRPDGIVFTDDWLALGFCQAIASSNYHPRMAVQTNRQGPISFPLPTHNFEIDLAQLARRSVQMALGRLVDPAQVNTVIRMQPTLRTSGKDSEESWGQEPLQHACNFEICSI